MFQIWDLPRLYRSDVRSYLAYAVGVDFLPNNFDIYYINKVRNMVESICFLTNSQANKQCPSTFPTTPSTPPPPPIVTEEWRNFDYKEIPGIPDFNKVFITCINQQVGDCLHQPGKITEIHPFAGFDCISNPSGCDFGKLDASCVSDISTCDFINKKTVGNFIIHQPPRQDATGTKSWTATMTSPRLWILDGLSANCSSLSGKVREICFVTNVIPFVRPDVKFTAKDDVLTEGKLLEGKFFIKLFQTTRCDVNKKCQVIPGPAFNIKGPYTVVGPELHTGINVKQGDVINIHASGLVDFGGAVFGIGAPILGPDGDNEITPIEYPDQTLKKNSLIVKIGNKFYQGGTDKRFTSTTSGEIILRANDLDTSDNSRGWSVSLTVN